MPFQPFAHDWDRAWWYDPEQWNWLKVEIEEIRRCVNVGDQAHDRLALLLTDHLVEVIVDREVNTRTAWQLPDHVIEELQDARARGAELPAELATALDQHVGPDDRERRDMHLHDKTKYLVKHGVLTADERQVLDRMHEYRNAAYHRDILDGDVISDLVLAYMTLASQLLARHQPSMVRISSGPNVTIVTPAELPGLLTNGLETDLKGMSRRFSDHVAKRADVIGRAIGVARILLVEMTRPASEPDVPMPEDDFVRLLTTLNDVTPARLVTWEKRAAGLKMNNGSLIKLMVRYIGLDLELSPVEVSARRLQAILDKWEADAEDEAKERRALIRAGLITDDDEDTVGPAH